MRCYLANNFVLKRLEMPALYDIKGDELYELDEAAFDFLSKCALPEGCSSAGADRDFIAFCFSEGILKNRPNRSNHSIRSIRSGGLNGLSGVSLRYLELQITDRCNLKCRHCYIDRNGRNELEPDMIKDILDEFESMQGLRLLITGGEPTVHSAFGDVNALLPDYGFRKILFTNGLLLGKELLDSLNVDEIQFSIDGMERGHDALRGEGTYKKVMSSIEAALASGMTVSVATMVHRENIGEFDAMEKLFKDMDIRDWTVDVPCMTGRQGNETLWQLPPAVAGRFMNYGFGGGMLGGSEGYACGQHLMSVLANGTVAKCGFYALSPVGSVDEGLRNCRSRLAPVKLQALQCAEAACAYIEVCRGGCRFRASINQEAFSGGSLKKPELSRDIYKCFAYGILK